MAEHDDAPPLRASNADRAEVADRLAAALADGRLTPAEADERLAACYAAKYERDLADLTQDLPVPVPRAVVAPTRSPLLATPLLVHAALASLLSVMLIAGWAAAPHVADIEQHGHHGPQFQGGDFFWPILPIFWLAVSVLVHAAVRLNRRRTT